MGLQGILDVLGVSQGVDKALLLGTWRVRGPSARQANKDGMSVP